MIGHRVLATSVTLLLALPSVANAQESFFCNNFAFIANTFQDRIADIASDNLEGTSEDVPPPYDEFVILGVEPPCFAACNATIRVNFRFTSLIDSELDSDGYADVFGTWDPTALFDFNICIEDLNVYDVEIEGQPEIIEEFARNYINDQFENPECFPLFGEVEESDNNGDDGNTGADDGSDGGDDGSTGDDGSDNDGGLGDLIPMLLKREP
eukprot:CAMPEP_0178946450 /NCGR_PEP_ID=MMETSP0789-20121207/4292_1 /TAXON_ID=3005 /ORGANISM="Rhizosolenia setigera, Strain CCMP 1694" /LENGTH=210 /DNA_ID=CAMNT_0020626443 /DNA_START=118 /DNA_END=753 /DNA_ORIENTATION=+